MILETLFSAALAGAKIILKARALTAAPALALPILRNILDWVLDWVFKGVEEQVSPALIQFENKIRTEAQVKAYEKAKEEFRHQLEQKEKDNAALAKSRDEWKKRARELGDMRPDH